MTNQPITNDIDEKISNSKKALRKINKINKRNKKILDEKSTVVTYDDVHVLDDNYLNVVDKNNQYSLVVDPDNIYNMTPQQKEFIKQYCQWKSVATVCNILGITNEQGLEYYNMYSSQQEIRRINLAMYARQFNSKMVSLDQLGGYLTSLITDENVAMADRLSTKDKLSVVKLIMEITNMKKEAYENPAVMDVIEVNSELEKLSVKSIKQLIENSNSADATITKENIINELSENNKLTMEEKIYLKSLSINELLALQEKINKGE